ncbi:hypothetical protein BH09CHL1_BH09CHL1_06060 [soil metagenome]
MLGLCPALCVVPYGGPLGLVRGRIISRSNVRTARRAAHPYQLVHCLGESAVQEFRHVDPLG